MPYRWKNKIDADETIVVIMNVLDKSLCRTGWSTQFMGQYRLRSCTDEVFQHRSEKTCTPAMKYFEEGQTLTPI